MDRQSRTEGKFADPIHLKAAHYEPITIVELHDAASLLEYRPEALRRSNTHQRRDLLQLTQGPTRHEFAAIDHDHIIDKVLNFTEKVTRHEDRITRFRTRPQEIPHFSDARRVQPVAGFIEDQHWRVAEQGCSEPKPLAHPERVGTDAPIRGIGQAYLVQKLIDSAQWNSGSVRDNAQVVASTPPWVECSRFE